MLSNSIIGACVLLAWTALGQQTNATPQAKLSASANLPAYPKGFVEAATVFRSAPATNRYDAAATLMNMLPTTPVTSTNGPIDYKARTSRIVTHDYNKSSFVLTESEAVRLFGSPTFTNSATYSYLIQREVTNNLQTFLLIEFYGGHAVLSTIY